MIVKKCTMNPLTSNQLDEQAQQAFKEAVQEQYILKTHSDGSVTTVKDVQEALLPMLKEIDALCRKHNIPYFLSGGSALGAVRHKGFIPWDDDADIAMMREDYERFLKVLETECPESYIIHCFETRKKYNVLIPAMKIRKKGTYLQEANIFLANRCKDSDGLFVDVFVFDYCTTNKWIDLPFRLFNMALMPLLILIDNIGINPVGLKKLFLGNAKLYGRLCRKMNSNMIGFDLTWTFKTPFKPFIFKKEDIYPVQYVDFEELKLPIAAHPHEYLCVAIAPSYMQLPKNRTPKHIVDINLHGEKPTQ